MIHRDGTFRTDDLALASLLSMQDYPCHMRVDPASGRVIWCLERDDVDADLAEICDDYRSGKYAVEPNRFLREVGYVRQAMYRFLGQGDKPKAKRVRPRPAGH